MLKTDTTPRKLKFSYLFLQYVPYTVVLWSFCTRAAGRDRQQLPQHTPVVLVGQQGEGRIQNPEGTPGKWRLGALGSLCRGACGFVFYFVELSLWDSISFTTKETLYLLCLLKGLSINHMTVLLWRLHTIGSYKQIKNPHSNKFNIREFKDPGTWNIQRYLWFQERHELVTQKYHQDDSSWS